MDNRFKQIARTGIASKGIVYLLTGVLAFGAAFGLSQTSEGKLGVLKLLEEQPFGKVLLGLLGVGLLCYSFWRFLQSIKDPENIGREIKGIGKRIGFFLSGCAYLGLGIFSIFEIFGNTSGGSSKSEMISVAYLPYIFYATAAGLALKAIFQFIKAYQGNFLSKFQLDGLSNGNMRKTIQWLAYAGLVSRGTVVGIVAYFFFKAAISANKNDLKGTSDAFSFLRQNSEGPWLMGLVAFGLICYGIYMLIMAKNRRFDD